MKSTADLIVNAASSHRLEGPGHDRKRVSLMRLEVGVQKKIDGAWVGEFGFIPEPAVLRVGHALDTVKNAADDRRARLLPVRLKSLNPANCLADPVGAGKHICLVGLVGARDALEHPSHSGATVIVVRRKIGASVKGLAVRCEECSEWPPALPGQRAHCGLIAGINVRALVPIDFHRNVVLIDNPRDVQWVATLELRRKQRIGRVLIRDHTREPTDGGGSNRCRAGVGRRRIRSAVDNGMADLHSSGEPVDEHPAGQRFQAAQGPTDERRIFVLPDVESAGK